MVTLGSTLSSGLTAGLDTLQTHLLSDLKKLSSGRANSSAADNPAAIAQSASYNVQISSLAQNMNSMEDSSSMLSTASGALGQVSDSLQQLNQLAVQAGDGALSASDRQNLQSQANQLLQGIDQTAGNSSFGGINLLDGSFNQGVQVGGDGSTQAVAIPNSSSSGLGLSGLDLTSATGQSNALGAISNALQQVSSTQSQIGAVQTGISAGLSNAAVASENLAAANSQISDTDYASAATSLSQDKVKQQAAVKALSLYNNMQKGVLSLLP